MSDFNSASLILKTSDFTSQSDFIYGTVYNSSKFYSNEKMSSMTWRNINLRDLLGDIYDKYDYFNICLNTLSTSQANLIDGNTDARNVSIKLNGLSFYNQGYTSKSLTVNNNSTIIGTFNFTPSSSSTQYYYGCNIATFKKSADIVDITIEYPRILDDVISNSNLTTASISSLTATGSNGASSLTLSSVNANVVVGSKFTASVQISVDTCITSINGAVVTLSKPLIGALSATAVTITPCQTYPNSIFIFDIVGIPNRNLSS
jgi:hypothetical protein